jgi:hypothetical protein
MTRADEIRADARWAAELGEPERRFAIKQLVADRWRISVDGLWKQDAGLVPGSGYKIVPGNGVDETEADIFRLAYGDPAGAEYWRAWLFEPLPKADFINLSAAHRAENAVGWEGLHHRLAKALKAFPAECGRAEAERLLANPNTAALLPGSLRRWLQPAEKQLKQKSRRGRSKAPYWSAAYCEIDNWLEENGCPGPGDGEQAKLEEHVADWLKDRVDSPPSESTIRKAVSGRMKAYKTKIAEGR